MSQSTAQAPAAAQRTKVFRRRYLIDHKFQLNFSLLLLIIAAINIFFFSMLFFFYDQELAFVYQNVLGLQQMPENIAQLGFGIFVKTIIFVVIFETFAILILGIFFSHRVAGPVFNLRQRIKEMIEGWIPEQVKLRRDDMLQDFAEDMDKLVKKMRADTEEDISFLEGAAGEISGSHKDKLNVLLDRKRKAVAKRK